MLLKTTCYTGNDDIFGWSASTIKWRYPIQHCASITVNPSMGEEYCGVQKEKATAFAMQNINANSGLWDKWLGPKDTDIAI